MPLKRLSDLGEFEKTNQEWNSLLRESEIDSVFLTHEWFYGWWNCFSADYHLEILLYTDQKGTLKGIAPFKNKGNQISFLASHEVTDYCDFIVGRENKESFFREILSYIKKNHPTLEKINLINIPSKSATLSIMSSLALEYAFSVSTESSEVVPILMLPDSIDTYLFELKRKNRHELRRKIKRVKKLPGLSLKKIKKSDEIKKYIKSFIHLHELSGEEKKLFWQKRNIYSFFENIAPLFSLKEWIELLLLYQHEKLIAALLFFDYHNVIYLYNTAYSPDYAWYSPGTYLFYDVITSAIRDKKEKVDFLRGQENYKFFFHAKESTIHNLILIPGE